MNASSTDHTNRSRSAFGKRRMLRQTGWIDSILAQSNDFAAALHDASPEVLRAHTDRLRDRARQTDGEADSRLLVLAAAAVIESVRRVLGLRLFDVQVRAGIIVACGAVAEMQTGEGKTLSVALPAYVRSLNGRGVHVATPNSYLAERDFEKLEPVFSLLGVTTGLLRENTSPQQTRMAYQADITYGPGHAFGFDYLRDQLTLDKNRGLRLGDRVYSQACAGGGEDTLLQRGLAASIVDEIDHVLIDDAVSPLLLSTNGNSTHDGHTSPDAELHLAARELASHLEIERDFTFSASEQIQLTSYGFDRIYADTVMAVHCQLIRPWHEYVVLALRAMHRYRRDQHYIVRNDRIEIVDASTGRIFKDRTWSDGLHQAIEAAEGLPIRMEARPLAKITRQRFYRYYEFVGGMTGTATGCDKEFASVYGLPIAVVPLRRPSQRILLPEHVTVTAEEKWTAIADEAESMITRGRAVLIGTTNIAESIDVARALDSRDLVFELLNGVQDADEAAVIAKAGQPGAITVATNLAGRGTDIKLDPSVARCGGLHVIVAQKHALTRIDRQLIGRCARCGDPGSARVFLSADDTLSKDHAPWIARAIQRWDQGGRSGSLGLEKRLRRIQSQQQRQESSIRWRLLKSDREDEKLLSKSFSSPSGCWQL